MRRIATRLLLSILAFGAATDVSAATLYGVTLRNRSDSASGGAAGEIYEIDIATAKARRLASLSLDGHPIGLRGLAVHSKTHVFYAITASIVGPFARALVTVEPANGNVHMIGDLGTEGSDINFDAGGRLYIWLPGINALGNVDLGTGRVRADARSALTDTVGGGFAIMTGGAEAVLSATSAAGTLDVIDLKTGSMKNGPRLSGAPFVAAITAMDFAPDGRLFAINTNLGEPSRSELVALDVASGHVTDIGPLPDDMTALAFGPEVSTPERITDDRRLRTTAWAGLMTLIGLVAGFVVGSRLPQ